MIAGNLGRTTAFFLDAQTFPGRRCSSTHRRRRTMATYVTLVNFTDQGIRNIKDSPERLAAFRSLAEKAGVAIRGVHYTVGAYDIVTVVEGSDEAVTAALLKLGSMGNVRTQTMRAFSAEEMKAIVGKMP
jgi:uncharacterized protein with GYD domain